MDKKTLEKEKQYLDTVFTGIDKIKSQNNKKIKQNTENIENLKKIFAESYGDIHTGNGAEFGNEDEYASMNIQIEAFATHNDLLKNENARLDKQKKNPYFGRFDFQADGEDKKSFYIGLGMIQTPENVNLVYDWRADICSLYYDDKFGKTSYECPEGEISGKLSLKRQYKIENKNLSYYIDSSLVIDDDILMEQLSKNTTSKMHEIVSTIQKEQNVLIRNQDFENTIVHGVAGSGKTSVAMHRVSYLLFKYRGKLKSDDILILSPSETFSEYIDEVLPSLGEQSAYTTTFSNLAKRLYGEPFETREELLENVIDKQSQKTFEDIALKSSFEFLDELKSFLKNDLCNLFIPKTLVYGEIVISKEEIMDVFFTKLKNLSVFKRIEVLAEFISDKFHVSAEIRPDLVKRAKKILYNRFVTTDLVKIYNLFLEKNEIDPVESVGAYDIAPILLIKESLFGLKHNFGAKYVIVDEMQDYTPCHFALFDKIWDCAKLYLGDINQSIDRTLPASYLYNLARLTRSQIRFLHKSYRSTLQISLFSQKILGKKVANNVNRNGEEVSCIKTKDMAKKIEEIVAGLNDKKQSVAVICKTNEQIKKLQQESSVLKKFKKLEDQKGKLFITTPAKAKGVEFDCVIVPFADKETYSNELDRNLLYVCATRALHKLFFVTDKTPSKFLMKNSK